MRRAAEPGGRAPSRGRGRSGREFSRRAEPSRGRAKSHSVSGDYFERSRQPLEILAFIAPLIVIFEVGLVGVLRRHDGGVLTNRAHSALLSIFDRAGVDAAALQLPALSLPAVAVIVVLLTWQTLARRPWSLHLPTVGGMAIESALTSLPVIVTGWLVAAVPIALLIDVVDASGSMPVSVAMSTGAATDPRALGVPAQIAISIGAGIYEEFVFRLILVSALHSLLKRLPGVSERGATVAAVIVAAGLFALYHPVIGDGTIAMREATTLFLAGLWWGTLFVVRGFGIAVGSHAAYDALVLMLPPLLGRGSAG